MNHIGKIILERVTELGMNKSEFARRINKSRQNVQDIFQRESIDSNLLLNISRVLNYNFFLLLGQQEGLPKDLVVQEGVPNYKTTSKGDKDLAAKIDACRKEIELLKKEVINLQKVISSLEKEKKKKKKSVM